LGKIGNVWSKHRILIGFA